MRGLNRQILLLLALFLSLAGACGWSFGALRDSRRAADVAHDDLRATRALARAITLARGTPSLAAASQPQLELTGRIERAADGAGLARGGVERIGQEQQRRLDDRSIERTRQLFLRDAEVRQIFEFLHALASDDAGLRVAAVRLTAPRGEEAGNRWNAEITLSYTTSAEVSRDPDLASR